MLWLRQAPPLQSSWCDSCPIIHPLSEEGLPGDWHHALLPLYEEWLPGNWHHALLYLPPASKSRLISHCPSCSHSSVNSGRKNREGLPNGRPLMIIEVTFKSDMSSCQGECLEGAARCCVGHRSAKGLFSLNICLVQTVINAPLHTHCRITQRCFSRLSST